MLFDYFGTVCKHLVAEHGEMVSVERVNRRIMLTKGEVHVERKEKAEALQVSFLLRCLSGMTTYLVEFFCT